MFVTQAQHEQLLKPVNGKRVASRKQNPKQANSRTLSYLEAWDVKAHLTRIFGYCGWSWEVLSMDLCFDEKAGNNYEVAYRCIGRLTIHPVVGDMPATYTEAAVGSAYLPQRGEAHDMACKTAESDAIKRAAINLGDQFGLSLYNAGSVAAVVGGTLVAPPQNDGDEKKDVDEYVVAPAPDSEGTGPAEPAPDSQGADKWVADLKEAIPSGVAAVMEIATLIKKAGDSGLTFQGQTLEKWVDRAVVQAGGK